MKFVIQRVLNADVKIEDETVGSIKQGLLVFIGVADFDTREVAERMVKKLIGLRIFADESGKTNLDIKAVMGELLMISQFTLYADCRKGNRPSFTDAGNAELANELYEYVLELCRKENVKIAHGVFGAGMKVSLLNDGPFTIVLDSRDLVGS